MEILPQPPSRADLDALLRVSAPAEPDGFHKQWSQWRAQALETQPHPEIKDTGRDLGPWHVFDLRYQSTDHVVIGGWFLRPREGISRRAFVVGHGYGGRSGPDGALPFPDASLLFYCARGISRSSDPRFPADPAHHVVTGIETIDGYILRGCAEDLWLAVGALLRLAPEATGRVGYLGTSFGGGVGALALPFDDRIRRGHLCLPTFGHQPLRMTAPSLGSAAAVQEWARRRPGVAETTLAWFDAAVAARHMKIPMHLACALTDPCVAPAGQFAIYNALPAPKQLFVLDAGHAEYPGQDQQLAELAKSIEEFFKHL